VCFHVLSLPGTTLGSQSFHVRVQIFIHSGQNAQIIVGIPHNEITPMTEEPAQLPCTVTMVKAQTLAHVCLVPPTTGTLQILPQQFQSFGVLSRSPRAALMFGTSLCSSYPL
jgi:hypothetical protein